VRYILSLKEAHEKEISYIASWDATNPVNGYNVSRGGDGVRHTSYTKAKIGKASIGTNKKRFADPKNVIKQSKALSKYWAKEEVKLKASVKHGGKPFAVKDKRTDKIIGIWFSQRGCARDLGISPGIVNNCLKCRRTHCGIYIFEFIGDN